MLNFCDFIQVYVFTKNHHLKVPKIHRLYSILRERKTLLLDCKYSQDDLSLACSQKNEATTIMDLLSILN